MAIVSATVDVKFSGPIFDGSAKRTMELYADEIGQRVALFGVILMKHSTVVFKRPTGFYRSRITYDRRLDSRVIHDQRVVYGPWLEGVSRRNASSRFKGYHLFRKATPKINSEVQRIAADVWPAYKSRLGG